MAQEGLGGERTEKATEKKRSDAREKGNVLKSTEVNTAVCTLAMFAALKIFGPWLARRIADSTAYFLGHASELQGEADVAAVFVSQVPFLLLSIAPFLLIALVVGVAINIVQVGFLFTTEAMMPKFSRLNPAQGLKRMFSTHGLAELVKSILKIVIIGIVLYNEYKNNIEFVVFLTGKNTMLAIANIMNAVINMGFKAGMVLCIIAAMDFFYQWWRYEKELRMSKQEIKEEYKQQEGSPEIKSKIKQKQRQMSMMRMMRSVPEADVVITNPTHYAVALKYEEGQNGAPTVIAKGQDHMAQRIKEIAREHTVGVVENREVAQALFRLCEVGDQIPEEMYQAVAEILAYVYKLKKKA